MGAMAIAQYVRANPLPRTLRAVNAIGLPRTAKVSERVSPAECVFTQR